MHSMLVLTHDKNHVATL